MLSIFDDDDEFRARANAPAEKHLRSPILASLLERVILYYNSTLDIARNDRFRDTSKIVCLNHNFRMHARDAERKNAELRYSHLPRICEPFLDDLKFTSHPPDILTPSDYPTWMRHRIKQSAPLQEAVTHAHELYREEINAFKNWATVPELQSLAENELNWTTQLQKETYLHYESYRYWDIIVERYRKKKLDKNFGKTFYQVNDRKIFFYDGFLMEQIGEPQVVLDDTGKVVRRFAPRRYIYSFEQAQMFQDAALARFNAFLALDANMHNGSAQTRKLLSKLLLWQESVLKTYGNKGYELVKGPESVYKSYLTELTNGDVLPVSSFVRTCAKLISKEEKLSKNMGHPRVNELIQIVQETKDLSTAAELFGCTKLSGHPFVYASVSAASVREEACPPGKMDLVSIQQHHNHFKLLVLQQYIRKHKTWPLFLPKNEPLPTTKLYSLWKKEILHLPVNAFPLSDLTDVEFRKFMEFDYSPDYLDMIDDKAICPGAQHAAGFWYGSNAAAYRRLLESLIKKKDVDTYAIVERMRRGKFTIDERIVELTQKEREFKTSARCFAKLTFEVRLFFVLTEANLKRFMGGENGDDGYMPQQTMTMSSSKLRRRLYDLTANKERNNTCLIEVDFSRWNLRWRAETVNPISRSLEHIFGLPGVFSQAHTFFESSVMVLTDKHSLPKGVKPGMHAHQWPNSDLVWRNHRGGLEGIQQTLWTIDTIAMMFYALQDENCSFIMAGQGDNQVFYVSFDIRHKTLQESLYDFLLSLERGSERLNHEVKPEECMDALNILTYGKEIYVSGVHILYSLKFSSRAFSRLDHSIPSLTKEIAGIVSNSIAVSGTLKNSIRAIWWKFVQVLLMFRRRRSSLVSQDEWPAIDRLLSNRTSRKILLIPGSLGGLPMMPWTRYFSKGETDDLSFDVAATYHLSQHVQPIRNYVSLLLGGEFMPHKVDPTNLINDPHSIPIDKPDDASHLVADAIGRQLPSIVVNKDLAALVNPTLRNQGEKYKLILSKMDPIHPKIASDLFDLTPAGLYNKTVKRFSMTRTIERILPGMDMTHIISRASSRILNTLIERYILSLRIDGKMHPKPFDTACRLRAQWGLKFDNAAIGVYTPFDFELSTYSPRVPSIAAFVDATKNILETKGSAPPNFGTSTLQKLSDHGYKIVSTNSTMRDIKRAVIMYSELQADPTISPIINSIIEARSPWKLDQLIPLFPTVYGGTSVHRHNSNHKFSILGSCSVPTHIRFSSDRAGILSGGESDYPVVFQTNYLTLTNLYQIIAAHNIPLPSSLAYIVSDSLHPIDTRPSKLPEERIISPKWPKLDQNRLAWVEDLYATEVPVIPDPKLIPHIAGMPDIQCLIYSYMECVISPQLDGKKIWDGILGTSDMFDFKEISRVNPRLVEIAMAWTILTDVYFSAISSINSPNKLEPLKDIYRRKTMIYAGEWVRLRLHPMFLDSRYNQTRSIALQPAASGYKRPVEYMACQLRRLARELLEHNSFPPELILFDNWRLTSAVLSKRRLTLACVLGMYPNEDISVVSETVIKYCPPKELLSRDPATYIHASARQLPRVVRGMNFVFPTLQCRYLHKSPQEAMRLLRTVDAYSELRTQTLRKPAYTNHGSLHYKLTKQYGSISMVESKQSAITNETRLRVLRRRKIGTASPLFSDWNAVLTQLVSRAFSGITEAHLFGVGRGSTGRFTTSINIKSIGYDLMSSIPQISHRSSSYVPSEISTHGNSSLFEWSDHTFRTSGNVLEGNLDFIGESNQIAIIDLDCPISTLVELLKRLPLSSKVIIRHRGVTSEITHLLSLIHPDKAYCLVMENNAPRDVIMYCSSLPPIGTGNSLEIEITKCHEILYTYSENELLGQLWHVAPRICSELEIDTSKDSIFDVATTLSTIQRGPSAMLPPITQSLHHLLRRKPESLHGSELRTWAICHNILVFAPAI
ncbi:RNA-dependent RNA polymerase [Alternaria tenuissima negative-stranded RNA virus 2]|nr:RNA-dependent RNA polymerase [Alternaria tenuissima negative-stranded RNA virus 2]